MELQRIIQDGVIVEITPVKLPLPHLFGLVKSEEFDSYCYIQDGKVIHKGEDLWKYESLREEAYPVKYYPLDDSLPNRSAVKLLRDEASYYIIDWVEDAIWFFGGKYPMITYGKDIFGNEIIYPPTRY